MSRVTHTDSERQAKARIHRSGFDGNGDVAAPAREGLGGQRLESGAGSNGTGGRCRRDREVIALFALGPNTPAFLL